MSRKPTRQLTAHERAILAAGPTDVWLPEPLSDREAAIDRLARRELPRRTVPTCDRCGSVLSIVTWTCVRGEHCRRR